VSDQTKDQREPESAAEIERLEEGNYTLITALKIVLRRNGDRLEYSQEELFDAAEDGRGIYFGPEGITLEEVPEEPWEWAERNLKLTDCEVPE
jgi:hypothetical protein